MKEKNFGVAQRLTDDQLEGVVGGVAMDWGDGALCGLTSTGGMSGTLGAMSESNTLFGSIVAPAENGSITSATNGKS